jgi:DNA-binding IclR family transcriptional regulator
MRLLEKGQLLLQGLDIRNIAGKPLQELAEETGQTVHLVIRDGAEGVYIDKVEGRKAAIRYSRIGRRVPLHSSAVGKVLAAFLPESELGKVLAGYVYTLHTLHTIASEDVFRKELQNVRLSGLAFDREENEPGVRCAAAPVYDHNGAIAAAISISTMVSAVSDRELGELAERLRRTAERISAGLGYRPR